MRKKLSLLLIAVVILPYIAGCSLPSETVPVIAQESTEYQQCQQLEAAANVIEDSKNSIAEQYDESYFESADWQMFVDSYWAGFWEHHKYCKACNANGDVPDEYLQ